MKNNKRYFTVLSPAILIIVVLWLQFYIVDNLKSEFTTSSNGTILSLQREFTKVNNVLEIYGKMANDSINQSNIGSNFDEHKYASFINYFRYDKERDIFHLDELAKSDFDTTKINNITGKGNLDFLKDRNNVKTKEIFLSIMMNDSFSIISDKIDASYWVYYTSRNSLLSIRSIDDEFVHSDRVSFKDDYLDMPFITDGYKENLPNRHEVFWTHPYIDLGGAGLMVTASYPVDYKNEYIGSISIDFVATELNQLLSSQYKTFILDQNGVIISTNTNYLSDTKLITFDQLPLKLNYEEIKDMPFDEVLNINSYRVIASDIKDTPYVIYKIQSRTKYLFDALVDMVPMLIFLALFTIVNFSYLKVKESEGILKSTLDVLENKQRELDYFARFDPLTNVYNRRGLYMEIDKLKIGGILDKTSLIIMDIDYFKKVNDIYGHNVGDDVLEELCLVITNLVGENGIVARYGGEEFVTIFKNCTLAETLVFAEKIRFCVENHTFKTVGKLTISIGVSDCDKNDTNDTWFKKADNSLYYAKESGRNTVCYFEDNEIKIYK